MPSALIVVAFALSLSQDAKLNQRQWTERPQQTQQDTNPQPESRTPSANVRGVSANDDTGPHKGERGRQEPSGDFWRITLADLITALATTAMAVIAALQFVAFRRQSKTLGPQLQAMQSLADAITTIAKNAQSIPIAIARVENRMTTLESTIRAQGQNRPNR